MKIFISGIGGAGMAPLAEIAQDAGHTVVGSDLHESLVSIELERRNIDIVYDQTYENIQAEHLIEPIDWFIYTSALPDNAPELEFARKNNIRTSKRDEFLAEFIAEHNLKLIAIAGTHGKTTTTGMFIWAMQKLGVPISYSLGTTINFGPSGKFDPSSKYFIYECDEYDKNFLHFNPAISVIPSLDYDHADTYPTLDDYKKAFKQFFNQSGQVLLWEHDYNWLDRPTGDDLTVFNDKVAIDEINLPGQFMRDNAFLVQKTLQIIDDFSDKKLAKILADFPGTDRRFEKIGDHLYSDYAHHPAEIKATIEKALEINPNVVVIYQPHQNIRQHEIADDYADAFTGVKQIYWIPTYLTRENPDLKILKPQDLIAKLNNSEIAKPAELNDELYLEIQQHQINGELVLILGAGPIDGWIRKQL